MNKTITKLRKRKRWLIDRRMKKTTTPTSKEPKFPIFVLMMTVLIIIGMATILGHMVGRYEVLMSKYVAAEQEIGVLKDQKRPIIIRPRKIEIKKEVETKTEIQTKYVYLPRKCGGVWQRLPERRGAYIR